MDINTLEIGNRIRIRREELNITRNQLAELLDVTTKFCSDIESGAKGMSIKTLIKLSSILYVSTDYILFGEHVEKEKTPFTIFSESIPPNQADYYLRICNEINQLNSNSKH